MILANDYKDDLPDFLKDKIERMELLKNKKNESSTLEFDSIWDIEAKDVFPNSPELQIEFDKQKKLRKKKNL